MYSVLKITSEIVKEDDRNTNGRNWPDVFSYILMNFLGTEENIHMWRNTDLAKDDGHTLSRIILVSILVSTP